MTESILDADYRQKTEVFYEILTLLWLHLYLSLHMGKNHLRHLLKILHQAFLVYVDPESNHNSQSEESKIPLRANENSK